MSVTAAPPSAIPRAHPWRERARTALTAARHRTVTVVSAVRHHNWSPALTISGLATIDAAFYQHGWFAGLLATGLSALAFDWQREK